MVSAEGLRRMRRERIEERRKERIVKIKNDIIEVGLEGWTRYKIDLTSSDDLRELMDELRALGYCVDIEKGKAVISW